MYVGSLNTTNIPIQMGIIGKYRYRPIKEELLQPLVTHSHIPPHLHKCVKSVVFIMPLLSVSFHIIIHSD